MGPVYLSLEGLWGDMDGKTTRQDPQGRAVGTYNANVIGGSVELGGVLNAWDGATIRPSVALNYINYKYSDQDEIGLGAIFVDDFSKTMVNASLKIVFSQKFYTLPNKLPGHLDIKIGWKEFLKNDAITTTAGLVVTPGTKFKIIGDEYSNTGCDLGIGLRFPLTEKASLGVAYDCNITSDYKRHTVDASMRWFW
jgi:outer membrane autotransporter protein